MRYFQVALGVLFGVAVFLSLDYMLPSRNTVRITNVYNQMIGLNGANRIFYASPDTGAVETADGRRDVRFIATVRPNGKPFVYRNEDTGLIWPPYFKYDSANLHAVASDQVSTAENPKWVSISAYGWRIPWWSVYPNAISIRPVAGPEVHPMNWPAMLILAIIGVLLAVIWRMWNRFLDRREGRLVKVEQRVRDAGGERRSRLRRWFSRR